MLPGDRAALRALEVDLGDPVVLEHGDALLADVDGDEQLALRGRQRRAAWPACGAAGCVPRCLRASAGLPARAGSWPAWPPACRRLGLGLGLAASDGAFAAFAAASSRVPRRRLLFRLLLRPPSGGGPIGYTHGGSGSRAFFARRLSVGALRAPETIGASGNSLWGARAAAPVGRAGARCSMKLKVSA